MSNAEMCEVIVIARTLGEENVVFWIILCWLTASNYFLKKGDPG